jgi:hypothetical protein
MSDFIWLAHVGFHECVGKVVHGVLRLHRTYVAELCAVQACAIGRVCPLRC